MELPLLWILIISSILLLLLFLAISLFRKKEDRNWNQLIIDSIIAIVAVNGLILSIYSIIKSEEIKLDSIHPKIQSMPTKIEISEYYTSILLELRNYSEYEAKNFEIDINVNNTGWKKERRKVIMFEEADQLRESSNLPDSTINLIEGFADRDVFSELILTPGKSVISIIYDKNKEYFGNLEVYSGNKEISNARELSYEEKIKDSMGWYEVFTNLKNNESVLISLKCSWENSLNKKFVKILSYKVVCTKLGNNQSFLIIPNGIISEEIF